MRRIVITSLLLVIGLLAAWGVANAAQLSSPVVTQQVSSPVDEAIKDGERMATEDSTAMPVQCEFMVEPGSETTTGNSMEASGATVGPPEQNVVLPSMEPELTPEELERRERELDRTYLPGPTPSCPLPPGPPLPDSNPDLNGGPVLGTETFSISQ